MTEPHDQLVIAHRIKMFEARIALKRQTIRELENECRELEMRKVVEENALAVMGKITV